MLWKTELPRDARSAPGNTGSDEMPAPANSTATALGASASGSSTSKPAMCM